MKKSFVFIFLLMNALAFSQFTLEHTYPYFATRVNLEYSGEKYYLLDDSTHLIMLYNADHTFWKSFPSGTTYSSYIISLSESKIDGDTNIEAILTSVYYISPTTHRNGSIVSENGNTLLTVTDGTFALDEISGLPNKIIETKTDHTSSVYSLPSLTLEHNYTEGTVKRVKLENSGEKYYLLDSNSEQAKIFNADHSLWKAIPLTKPSNSLYDAISLISENQVNNDPLVEISYSYHNATFTTNYECRLINENGNILLTVPTASFMMFDSMPGLQNKIITKQSTNGVASTSVYSLPSLTLEHSYPTWMRRIILDTAGEKYYTYMPDNGQCVVYNSDHTVWKLINLPKPINSNLNFIGHLSDTKLNADSLLELSYDFIQEEAVGFYYESKIINELGTVLLTLPDSYGIVLDEIPGLQGKLMGSMLNDNSGSIPFSRTVYNINYALSVNQQTVNAGIQLYQNPLGQILHVKSDNEIINVNIYNAIGVLVKHFQEQNLSDLPISYLTYGLYFIQLTDIKNNKSIRKFIVSN